MKVAEFPLSSGGESKKVPGEMLGRSAVFICYLRFEFCSLGVSKKPRLRRRIDTPDPGVGRWPTKATG